MFRAAPATLELLVVTVPNDLTVGIPTCSLIVSIYEQF